MFTKAEWDKPFIVSDWEGQNPAFTERPVLGCFLFSQSLDLPCVVLLT